MIDEHDPTVALVRVPTTALMRRHASISPVLFGVAGLFSIGIFLAGLPLVSMGIIAAAAAVGLAIGARAAATEPTTDPMPPEDILSFAQRETYRAILRAHEELQRTVSLAPCLGPTVRPVLVRCAAAVHLCARLARSSNPLQRYLDEHDATVIRSELDRLRALAETTTDERAVAALSHAAAARAKELVSHDEIAATRDRIHARLELVRAALDSFAALIVKLEFADEDQVVHAGEAVVDHLDDAAEELEVVESTLVELAA